MLSDIYADVKGCSVDLHYYYGPPGLDQSNLNSEVTVLVGLNVLYFDVMEILWDWPRVTIMARFDCI